jgi:imidazolonepropionase-like amidohydrolase
MEEIFMENKITTDQITTIINARIFDGKRVTDDQTVVINGAYIQAMGGQVPVGSTIVDANGAMLMPGLIDSHVHTSIVGLRDALLFGVTTEMDMTGDWTKELRKEVAERNDIADVRSAGTGITPPGGHPSEYGMPEGDDVDMSDVAFMFVSIPEDAAERVAALVAEGSDFIKIFMEDGTVLGFPGLPVLNDETLRAAVREAHRYGRLAIAHVTTAALSQQVIEAGMDCLAHMFIDQPHTPEIIAAIADSGAFVIPTLTVVSSAMGHTGAALAADERVRSKLSQEWLDALSGSMNVYPQGKLDDVFATVLALHKAGVDILAGTDVTLPDPAFGGLAHGASLHHELQLLVAAGLTPIAALRSATSIPARRFGFTDRGRIAPGKLADLLLVDGDPLTNISDTLSIRAVWHRGVQLNHM